MLRLLDTSVLIHLRDADTSFDDALSALEKEPAISLVSRIELEGGVVAEPKWAAQRRRALDLLLAVLPTLDFDSSCADAYRAIIEKTGFSRQKILDRMIAATAMVHRATLVTTNPRDLRDIPDLTLEEWSSA